MAWTLARVLLCSCISAGWKQLSCSCRCCFAIFSGCTAWPKHTVVESLSQPIVDIVSMLPHVICCCCFTEWPARTHERKSTFLCQVSAIPRPVRCQGEVGSRGITGDATMGVGATAAKLRFLYISLSALAFVEWDILSPPLTISRVSHSPLVTLYCSRS